MNTSECENIQGELLAACWCMTVLPLEEFLEAMDWKEHAALVHNADFRRTLGDRALRIRALARGAQGIVRILTADPALAHIAHEAAERLAEKKEKPRTGRTEP